MISGLLTICQSSPLLCKHSVSITSTVTPNLSSYQLF